jgi:hypothetical protein
MGLSTGRNYRENYRCDLQRLFKRPGSEGELRGLHTAEVTGSIPVTPTSTNALPGSLEQAACQKICQRIADLGVFKAGQPDWVRAAVEATNNCALVGPRWV